MTTLLLGKASSILPLLLISILGVCAGGAAPSAASYIMSSCTATKYPGLCYASLTTFGSQIQPNPRSVAAKSLSVALSSAKSASSAAWRLLRLRDGRRTSPSVSDCAILLADAVKQLQRSVAAMGGGVAAPELGDVQTWASAALTDENTCMEGLTGVRDVDGKVVSLRRQVMAASQLTSNALALVNGYGSSRRTRPRHQHPHHQHTNNNHP